MYFVALLRNDHPIRVQLRIHLIRNSTYMYARKGITESEREA